MNDVKFSHKGLSSKKEKSYCIPNMIHFCKLKTDIASKYYTDTVAVREQQRKLLS